MISFIIPTHNNREMLPRVLQELVALAWEKQYTYEILIIDDASSDGSSEVLTYLQKQYPHLRVITNDIPLGHYLSTIVGISAAKKSVLLLLDITGAYPLTSTATKLLTPILLGKADCTLASRLVSESIITMSYPAYHLLRWGIQLFIRPLIPLIKDPLSSCIACKHTVIKNIPYSPEGLCLPLEILLKGHYRKLIEVGCTYTQQQRILNILSSNTLPLLMRQRQLIKQWQEQ